MKLEEKLEQLKRAALKSSGELELERQLDYLRRAEHRKKKLPAERSVHGIEHYVEGDVLANRWGEYYLAQQTLPFGRPYGKYRVGDVATADLSPLDLFMPGRRLPAISSTVFLDTETTGLAGGTGTCAFLIGIAAAEGAAVRVRQFFLRDFKDEKAALQALSDALSQYEAVVTFNGKTFDLPLLETRYTLARLPSPFARLQHLDLLHPARRLWKLRLESCELKRLEAEILGIRRQGDVAGAEIPEIYFDYLRCGNARGLQPVFFHNALDLVTLAALALEFARVLAAALGEGDAAARLSSSLDLFSLSRIFERAGNRPLAISTCEQALEGGLPDGVEVRALWHLAAQHKRRRQYDSAVEIWMEVVKRSSSFSIEAFEELAIHYEHRARDPRKALEFTEAALKGLRAKGGLPIGRRIEQFSRRLDRLRRKTSAAASVSTFLE